LKALAILKIQVHRDRGKELADNGRFTLATNIEACLCAPQSPRQRGSKVAFEEGPVLEDSVAKVFLSHRSQIFRAVGAAIEY
jgi:hypothetical protein